MRGTKKIPEYWNGALLRSEMERAGISDIELAAAVGLKAPQTVKNWTKPRDEPGATQPNADQILKAAVVLGCTPERLLGIGA